MIKVSKNLDSERHSIVYNGVVCPIDVKGAAEVEACGAGLNIRDAAMEKIFDVNLDNSTQEEESSVSDDNEDKGFKFWVNVDIYKMRS